MIELPKLVTGKRIDNEEIITGSLLYDLDHDDYKIIEYIFDIEHPKLNTQIGVGIREVHQDSIKVKTTEND